MWLQVERSSIVAAGALVTPGTTVPTGQIWAGRPAKLLREMAEGEASFIEQSAINYSALADVHADENAKTTEEIQVCLFWKCMLSCKCSLFIVHQNIDSMQLVVAASRATLCSSCIPTFKATYCEGAEKAVPKKITCTLCMCVYQLHRVFAKCLQSHAFASSLGDSQIHACVNMARTAPI